MKDVLFQLHKVWIHNSSSSSNVQARPSSFCQSNRQYHAMPPPFPRLINAYTTRPSASQPFCAASNSTIQLSTMQNAKAEHSFPENACAATELHAKSSVCLPSLPAHRHKLHLRRPRLRSPRRSVRATFSSNGSSFASATARVTRTPSLTSVTIAVFKTGPFQPGAAIIFFLVLLFVAVFRKLR